MDVPVSRRCFVYLSHDLSGCLGTAQKDFLVNRYVFVPKHYIVAIDSFQLRDIADLLDKMTQNENIEMTLTPEQVSHNMAVNHRNQRRRTREICEDESRLLQVGRASRSRPRRGLRTCWFRIVFYRDQSRLVKHGRLQTRRHNSRIRRPRLFSIMSPR